MEDIKIKTEKQLYDFLKVIAEEAVDISYKKLNEDTSAVAEKYKNKLADDKQVYNINNEVTKSEEPESKGDIKVTIKDKETDEEEAEEVATEADDFADSLDGLIISMNLLRSGKSLKDKEIKASLLDYWNRLSDEERLVLYTFIEALAKIVTGKVEGDQAQDPGDDPVNIIMKTIEKEKQKTADRKQKAKPAEKSPEDTTPPAAKDVPISPGISESADLKELRAKVRNLMLN